MDSVPDCEFHGIFDRVSQRVDLKGKFSEEEIEKELVKARNHCARRAEEAATSRERNRYKANKVQYERLVEHDFPRRVISEALKDPRGKIALTLRYGYEEAKRRLLDLARKRIGTGIPRTRRKGRRP